MLRLGTCRTSFLAVDSASNVYFADSANHVIRKISTAGIITTYAGKGTGAGTGFGAFSGDNGPALNAELNDPGDIAMDSSGNLYICDVGNSRVRKVTAGGTITTYAGNGNVVYEGDGVQASTTAVPSPGGIAVDAQGNVYISSAVRVRKVTPDGVIHAFAGTGTRGFSGDGGQATQATFRAPIGLAVDQFGNVYVADNSNGRVRKIDATGIITTYAGIDGTASTPLGDGGPATSAYLGNVGDLAIDSSGNLYISTGQRIRKVQPSGAGFASAPTSLTFSYTVGGAAPASQTLNITGTSGVLTYTATASSTGGWLSVQPPSGSTPGTLTVSVNPTGLGGGVTYQGTILLTPGGSGNSPLSINVSLTVSGAGVPAITSGGIVNATGYQAKLAPDTVFVIFGNNMGPSQLQAGTPNYQTNLGGTSISFTPAAGGSAIPAKMIYTYATQVAGLLPSSITPGTYSVTVTYNSLTSAPQNVTVVARSFGIATSNSAGTGTAQATIGNVNGGLSLTRFTSSATSFGGYNWTLTPAHPGDAIVLWGTGGGADPANDNGGTSGDQTAAGNFIVSVDGRKITPLYAGASSGYPGLWQINFQMPVDINPDCFAQVQVSAGGELSNTVNIPIAAAGQTACSDSSTPAAALAKLDAGANINVGAFGIARVTSSVSQDTASGSVDSFTPAAWITLQSGPLFGSCRVYDRSYPVGGRDPASPSAFLDAGAKLSLSGPNLPAGFGLGQIASAIGPSYDGPPGNGTLASGTYNLSGTGGTQVGPFSASTAFPASFNVTNWNNINSIDRTQPLTINWTSSGATQVVLGVTTTIVSGGQYHTTTINCTVPAAPGTYTIAQGALALLSAVAASGTSFGSISVQGATSAQFTANLTAGGQLDLGVFGANLGVAKNVAVQ